MSYHVAHHTRTLLGTFESNAEACFDCLVMGLVFIYFLAPGAPKTAIQSWETILKNIEHYVQTRYGVSKNS